MTPPPSEGALGRTQVPHVRAGLWEMHAAHPAAEETNHDVAGVT